MAIAIYSALCENTHDTGVEACIQDLIYGTTWCPGQFGQMGPLEVDMKLRDSR